ncbi:MAG: carbohydrate ABC transporter permease [Actinomycetales bacterium]|nr:carbohydrate ABC transporter permease [Actinomycetales bacterium]
MEQLMAATATRATTDEPGERGILSAFDRRRSGVRMGLGVVHVVLFTGLVVAGLGPVLWLAKAAVTPTQDTLSEPFALFPNGLDLANLTAAWVEVEVGRYFLNTLLVAAGCWAVSLLVAATGGYLLSVLRPRYTRLIDGAILATLFIPAVVLLVPLYLTVVRPAIGPSLLNNYLAVWLPAAANAFNVLLVKRFFDNLPREVFEAARTDGAGPFRLFWSIVLPMSRPILAVVSVFAIVASLKDYLWPSLVLPAAEIQPLGVRLPAIASQTELDVFLAALAIATLVPIVLFLLFQRVFLRSAGLGGAVKG